MPAPTLDRIARRSKRSGYTLAIICGIGLPFSFASPIGLLVAGIGLATGIAEVRRGGALRADPTPGDTLRTLGAYQFIFAAALAVYFGVDVVRYLTNGPLASISQDDRDTIAHQFPGLLESMGSAITWGTAAVGVVAVGWQVYVARRYRLLAENALPEEIAPDATATAPQRLSFGSIEWAEIQLLAARTGRTPSDAVVGAVRAALSKEQEPPRLPPVAGQ